MTAKVGVGDGAIIAALNWRYATKKFDKTKKLKANDFNELLEAMRLTASSYGIQPWKFLVIENKELREKIKSVAWNQKQVVDASNLIVLCAKKGIDKKYMSEYIKFVERDRNLKSGELKSFENMLYGVLNNFGEEIQEWGKRQVYIVLGNLLTSAAMKRIDVCHMEGFDAKRVDEILGLEKKGLTCVVICALGYRDESDDYAKIKKVRFPLSEVVERIR